MNIGKIDGHPSAVLASFKGYVRLYLLIPTPQQFNMSLIYENNFDKPIVNVEFVAHPDETKRNTIGVLFYRKFCYISFKKNSQTQNY